MSGVSRVGDIGVGVCPCHTTPQPYVTVFSTGANSVLSDNLATCIIGTIGIASCGHPTIALSGSGDVMCEGISVHRVGDVGANCGPYTVVSGAPDVIGNS